MENQKIEKKSTILDDFTEKIEKEYLQSIKKDIQQNRLDAIITNSINLIKKGGELSPKNIGLDENIDLFTYFTMLGYILKNKDMLTFAKEAHYIAMESYKNFQKYEIIKKQCNNGERFDSEEILKGSNRRLLSGLMKNLIKKIFPTGIKKLEEIKQKYNLSKYGYKNRSVKELEDVLKRSFNPDKDIRSKYDPNYFMEAATAHKYWGNVKEVMEHCLEANKKTFNSIYIYSFLGKFFEELSNQRFTYNYLMDNYDTLKKINEEFQFLPELKIQEKIITSLESGKCQENWENLNEIIKEGLREISTSFYKQIVKEIRSSDIFKKEKICFSKNTVYAIENYLLKEILIVKTSRKDDDNLEREKKIIKHYQKQKDLDLVRIVDSGIDANEQYLFFIKNQKLNMLDYLEILKEINNLIKSTKNHKENLEKISNLMYQHEDNFKFLKFTTFLPKNDFIQNIKNLYFFSLKSCLKKLAELNTNIPSQLIKKEFKKDDYKKDITDILSSFEKGLNENLSNEFKMDFVKNYDLISSTLASAQKFLYKDAYLKNWLISDSEPFDKEGMTDELVFAPKISPIDFERCAIAPTQLDLAFILDFGNFVREEDKEALIDYYIDSHNKSSIMKAYELSYREKLTSLKEIEDKELITDKEEFKRVFDYARVHRNLLNFRSYSRFIEEEDNNQEAKAYKKMSLENSIKALQKLISYENNNVDKLKSLCNDLKGMYHEIYR